MKLFYAMLFTGLWVTSCVAQTDTAGVVSADTIVKKASLTIGASYANNANYYGQKAQESIPYLALAATYKLKCGLYFTGLAYRLLHDTANTLSAKSAGAGLNVNLSKRLSLDLSYSHTFYPAYSPLLQAGNPDNASASLVYDNWVSSKLNVDYAFGKTSDVFITAGTGKQITLGHISAKDLITLTPSVDVVAGTQRFYQTYITEKKIRDSVLGSVLGPITGQPPPTQTSTKTTTDTRLDILSYNFKCPLAYNRAHYLFEIAYQLSVLSNKAQSNAGKANSFFTASFYYQF